MMIAFDAKHKRSQAWLNPALWPVVAEIRIHPRTVKRAPLSSRGVLLVRAKRDRLHGNDSSKRKFLVGKTSAPMVMTLRRKEESFDVAFQTLKQIGETVFIRSILQLSLLAQDVKCNR